MTDQQRERLQTLITASKAHVDREDVEQIAEQLEQESGATRLTAVDGVSVSVPTCQLPHAVSELLNAASVPQPLPVRVREAVDALLASIPAWQSIETAPKDGTRFIAGEHHKLYGWIWGGCRWYADANVTRGGYFAGDAMRPSHWHPLSDPPSPPTEEK